MDFEPFIELTTVASPLSTTSPAVARSSLIELHSHLALKKSPATNVVKNGHSTVSVNGNAFLDEGANQNSNTDENSLPTQKTPLQAQHDSLVRGIAQEYDEETDSEMGTLSNGGRNSDPQQSQMNDDKCLQSSSNKKFEYMYATEDEYYESNHRQRLFPSVHGAVYGETKTHSHFTKSGMLLEYIMIMEKNLMEKCISTFQPTIQKTPTNSESGAILSLPYKAVVVTVAISGSPYRPNFSPQLFSLRRRIQEFASSIDALKLCKTYVGGRDGHSAAQKQDIELMLLSLLMDDECLKTNSQFDLQYGNYIEADTEMTFHAKNPSKSKKLFSKKLKFGRKKGSQVEELPGGITDAYYTRSTALVSSSAPPADIAKIITDQMQVLSLSEKDMKLRSYKKENGSGPGMGKPDRDRGPGGLARSPRKEDRDRLSAIMKSPIRANRRMGRDLAGFDYVPPDAINNFNPIPSASSFGFGTGSYSDGTSVTATTVSTDSSASGPVPTLSGPSRDSSSTKRQLRRNKVLAASMNQRSRTLNGGRGLSPPVQRGKSIQSNFDPFAKDDQEEFGNVVSPSEGSMHFSSPPPFPSKKLSKKKPSKPTTKQTTYVPGSRKLFIAMALNEDLTCTYRGATLTSCAVQGVVQLQMKAKSTAFVPFILRMKDEDSHIGDIQENSDIANDLSHENEENDWKRKYIITLPKADTYYPVLKYVCSNTLVPVPLVSKPIQCLPFFNLYAKSSLLAPLNSRTEGSIKSKNQ